MPPRHERSYNMHEANDRHDAKRRKVRKGTRSCWECRRRKMKCIFASDVDAICISCRRRGAKCVGQEFPEEISAPLDRCLQMGDRLVRVEALLGHLLERIPSDTDAMNGCTSGTHNGKRIQDTLTRAPVELDGDTELQSSQSSRLQSAGPGKYERLSQVLHKALPSPEDIARIAEVSSDVSGLFYQILTIPYNRLGRSDPNSPQSLLEIPSPQAHPVLIARHMLHLATSLQHLHPDFYQGINELSEPPRAMMKRLAETAIDLVTTKDDLTGSIEGLECIMIESLYLANGGNLRQSLVAIRRAIITAQLIGFHRSGAQAQCKVLDPKTEAHPQYIWFRIVSAERHLCLMLGLPQGTLDHSMASESMLAKDTAIGRLERLHCVIASRILERNQSEPSPADFALTQDLDAELQRAAGRLPSKWWLTANPATAECPEALFWEVRRLFNQSFHFNLLNQLHLPYMLRSSSSSEHKYDYSRLTCVNASREVLIRFTMFRGLDRIAFRCRTVDFFALMAAMTLLLAHLDEHRRCAVSLTRLQQQQHGQQMSKPGNILAHQRLGDRAMMEQAQESMEEVCRLTEDALSAKSADMLRRLLAIEAEAAIGYSHRAESVSVQAPDLTEENAEERTRDSGGGMRVHIPYFGIIKIAGDSVISRETPECQSSVAGISHAHARDPGASAVAGTAYPATWDIPRPAELPPAYGSYNRREGGTEVGIIDPSAQYTDPFQPPGDITAGGLLQQHEYPLLTTEVGDLGFQGVDAAFFDSLMRGAGDGRDGTGWPLWPNEC